MNIVGRDGWGALPARSVTRLHADRVKMLVLHHTTGVYAGVGTVRAIQRHHMFDRKWADIGYSFLIAPTGEVYEGRGWDRSGAHAKGHNSSSIGVAYIGDGRLPVPDAVKDSVLRLSVEAERRFGVLRRVGHRDVGSTVCPGDVLYGWWTSNPTLPSVPQASEVPSEGWVAERGQVSAQGISERPSPIPDLRDGWRRHMGRMGWLRKG